MELRRRRGVQSIVLFPIIDADGDFVTGASFSPQISTWTDAIFPSTFLTIEAAAELGSSGWYISTLSATQTAADYLAFHASPSTAGSKRQHLLINFTAVASVTNVGSVSYAVPINWASISSPGATNLLTGTTVASISNPVPTNWASITNPGFANNFTATQFATLNNPAPLLWSSITSPGFANNLTGTSVASVNNPVPINWASVTNPGATNNLSGTSVASVSMTVASITNAIGTVTGVLNRVDATLTTAMGQMLADRLLARNIGAGSDGGRIVQDAFRLLRNRRTITRGAANHATLTVFSEDDSSTAWVASTSTVSAVAIDQIDPT